MPPPPHFRDLSINFMATDRFLQYIDRDPETIARQKELDRRNKAEKDDETRQREAMEIMMRRDREAAAARGKRNDHC